MKPETTAAILSHSCVAMLPPDVVMQTIETGAPTMPVHHDFMLADLDMTRHPEGLVKVAAWGRWRSGGRRDPR